jgi:hypothetical protein
VHAVRWSTAYKEIASGYDYPNDGLIIWEYPSMKKVNYLNFNGKK